MSSTNRGSERDLDDHYATPPQLTELICNQLKKEVCPDPVNVLEPGCGEGTFLDAIEKVWPEADRMGVELNPALVRRANKKGHNVVKADVIEWSKTALDWHLIIGNPPFKHADEFILALQKWLDPDHGTLAFLLRLNAFGSKGRYEKLWSKVMPYHVYILTARPGFTPDGRSDSIEYMVALFRSKSARRTSLSLLPNFHIKNKWSPGQGLMIRKKINPEKDDKKTHAWDWQVDDPEEDEWTEWR